MRKLFAVIRKFFFAVKVMVKATVAPVVLVVKKSVKGESISIGQLSFAAWRGMVVLSFLLCTIGGVGVPAIIAYLFLADLMLIGFQTVFYAIA